MPRRLPVPAPAPATPAAAPHLLSLAGLVGRPVRNQAGAEVGAVADAVARWEAPHQPVPEHPAISGLVVRVGRRRAWLPATSVATIDRSGVALRSSLIDLRDFAPRPGEVELWRQVVDHQLVDTEGVRVVRASDLYLAAVAGAWRLVAVDVGLQSLVRRLGPARWRGRPTPGRVVDWAAMHSFVDSGTGALQADRGRLRRLRPDELADLLEDLGRRERRELLAELPADQAADALEEMADADVVAVLRDTEPERAAELLDQMEPDEAADALRAVGEPSAKELLGAMDPAARRGVEAVLGHEEDRAGGMMTSYLVTALPADTVADLRRRLRATPEHAPEVAGVAVVDGDGRLLGDLTLADLLVADDDRPAGELLGSRPTPSVAPDAPLQEVADQLTNARRPSLLVVDDDGRPCGRILADDVVDALAGPGRWPRLTGRRA